MKTIVTLEFSLETPVENIADKIANRLSTMQGVDNMQPIKATLVEGSEGAYSYFAANIKTEKESAWNSKEAGLARNLLWQRG